MNIKPSDIVSHGRNDNGYHVFTCYSRGLGQYSIGGVDSVKEAKASALAYFREQAKKS